MADLENLKHKYDSLIANSLAKNRQFIIDAFVSYYGEEYRELIQRRYDSIVFVYYIDWNMVDLAVNKLQKESNSPNRYNPYKELYDSKNDKFPFLVRVLKNTSYDIVGMTDGSLLKNSAVKNRLDTLLSGSNPSAFLYEDENSQKRIITFQILSLPEKSIIHEINHAVTMNNLAFTDQGYISKQGNSVSINGQFSDDTLTEELLNDKSSEEIYKIFKKMGGDFSSFCGFMPLVNYYAKNYYLIDSFYDTYKEFIKKARITDSNNELVERVGKENFNDLSSIVNDSFSKDNNIINSNRSNAQSKIDRVLNSMYQHYLDDYERTSR